MAICISYVSGGCDWNAFQHIIRLCELSLAFKAQWSLYVPPVVTVCTSSGYCMYRHSSLCVPPVVTKPTATGHYMYLQWSLYVPPVVTIYTPPVVTICTSSGHYMYRQSSLCVQPVVTICSSSGHYMYCHRSLYVPPVNIQQFHVLHTQLYLCVLCGSENKQRLFPYTALTGWFV